MEIGFVVSSAPPLIEFRLFEPKRRGSVPLVTFAEFLCYRLVLVGRLYHRVDVLTSLETGLPPHFTEECRRNDAALALGAYSQFGLSGLTVLEGDFSLVVCDLKDGRLIACRDPLGGYPLFWTRHNERVAISTMLNPLLQLLPRRRINVDHLAEFLMSAAAGEERPTEECAYEQINRVQPGTTISLNVLTCGGSRCVHWNWLDKLVDPGTNKLEDIALQYGDLLRVAVRERIRGLTASHLSGGMDSTSISLIALDSIHSGTGHPPLHALSLVYERLPELSREAPYIESILGAGKKDLVGHRIVADDLLDYDSFADPPLHDEPYVGLASLGSERALTDTAVEVGADTILTGRGADDLLDIQPFFLTDLLRQCRFRSAWKEACKWAQARGIGPWGVLYPFGIANLFPAWRQSLAGRALFSSGGMDLTKLDNWSVPPWISPDFARRYSLRARAIENARRMFRACDSTPLSLALYSIERRVGNVYRWIVAAPRGVVMAHPFLDQRIIQFALGMQSRLEPIPGKVKPVLAEAMRGVLPENIRGRRNKRSFNQVYYLGMSRNLRSLEEMIASAPVNELGMFRKDILVRCLQDAALGVAGSRHLQGLDVTLSLIKWLSMQSEWRARVTAPSQVFHVRLESWRKDGSAIVRTS